MTTHNVSQCLVLKTKFICQTRVHQSFLSHNLNARNFVALLGLFNAHEYHFVIVSSGNLYGHNFIDMVNINLNFQCETRLEDFEQVHFFCYDFYPVIIVWLKFI